MDQGRKQKLEYLAAALAVALLMALPTFADDQIFDDPEPTLNETPVPPDSSLPPDDTLFKLRPAPQVIVRGGGGWFSGVPVPGELDGQVTGTASMALYIESGS